MTELVYLKDSYARELQAKVVSCQKRGSVWHVILDKTIFYPQGGGQPSDTGMIFSDSGKARVKHVTMSSDNAIHECSLDGELKSGQSVSMTIDWERRYLNMRIHSAGHVVHEAVMSICSNLVPLKAEHGRDPYIEYRGSITLDKTLVIESEANKLIDNNLTLTTEFVTYEKLVEKASYVPDHLPRNKPLRILTISGYKAIPDGGTQVRNSSEIGSIKITRLINDNDNVRVYYNIPSERSNSQTNISGSDHTVDSFISGLLEFERGITTLIESTDLPKDLLMLKFLGKNSEFNSFTSKIRKLPKSDITRAGIVLNEVKAKISDVITRKSSEVGKSDQKQYYDTTVPGLRPLIGHLHPVTQAIMEITDIFKNIGFSRVRHPEADWDWYAFEALNMPVDHPARDEWETFFVSYPGQSVSGLQNRKMILTPHTSNGQIREMEKGNLPIRMINIAKNYRRQSDISHVPMLHQFEGLYIDCNVSIAHLKGVCDYFFKEFYGQDRKSRLRPFHFQFTEPSFEIDVSCGICGGNGLLSSGIPCRLCKEGWLELGGAGMVHPQVLKNGGIDPEKYNGFAFGWGVERTFMMKAGGLDDVRIFYENDIRFLEQF